MGRRAREAIKGVAIVLLLCSAALLTLTVAYDSGLTQGPVFSWLSGWLGGSAGQPPRMAQAPALTDASAPMVISVLGQNERASFWGSFEALDGAYEALGSYLAAALDTARDPEAVSEADFAAAAARPGIYFRFPGPVPLPVLGAWLDAAVETELTASRFLLTAEKGQVALLAGGEGQYWRMTTQVDAAGLWDALDDYPADGTRLAGELDAAAYRRLDPLSLVDPARTALDGGESQNPCDETFMTATAAALGFNPYGDSKYRDDRGGTVYTESDCTLRISADGLLTLRNPGQDPRFSADSAGDGDRIEYVRALLQTVAGAQLGDARLQFTGLAHGEDGGTAVEFSYSLAGLPVRQSRGAAVSARFQGAVLTELRFRVRTYTLRAAEASPLLPAAQAAAVAPWGTDLLPAYADVGESSLQAGWLQ